MGSFTDGLVGAMRSGLCSYLALSDRANRFFNELSPVDLPNFSGSWRRSICDNDDPIPPLANEPGQCTGVLYTVAGNISETTPPITPFPWQRTNVPGPISLSKETVPGTSNCQFRLLGGSGYNNLISTRPCSEAFTDVVITRQDGQPDNCGGEIRPEPFPEEGDTYNITFDYTNKDGLDVNLSGTVNLFAPVIIGGNVFAPVNIDLGGIDFNGTLQLSPEFNFNLGDRNPRSGPNRPEPFIPTLPPVSFPTTPDDESVKTLVGVVVRSSITGTIDATAIGQGDAPTIYVPRLALVYFRVKHGNLVDWSGPFDVKTLSSYVPVPYNTNAITARCFWSKGFSGQLSLVFKDSSEE